MKYLVNKERELIGTCCALTYTYSYLLKQQQFSKDLEALFVLYICQYWLTDVTDTES